MPLDYLQVLRLGGAGGAARANVGPALEQALGAAPPAEAPFMGLQGEGGGAPGAAWGGSRVGRFSPGCLEGRARVLSAAAEAVQAQWDAPGPRPVSIPLQWVPGALALLWEVSDYENCILTAEAVLKEGGGFGGLQRGDRRDVLLAAVLSRWELARASLGSASPRVAEACSHLSAARGYLRSCTGWLNLGEPLVEELEGDVNRILERLVARCTLEHLALPLGESSRHIRARALDVLKRLLSRPSAVAIEATQGTSGVSREYANVAFASLTAAELASLVDWRRLVSNRPPWFDPAQAHRAGTALLLRGFLDKSPQLVRKAEALFQALADEQGRDTAAEVAICRVLQRDVEGGLAILGAAEELGPAEGARQAGQVRPTRLRKPTAVPDESHLVMEFIRENAPRGAFSQHSALLQGMVVFIETWMVKDAFPRFRDTVHVTAASLEAYFSGVMSEGAAAPAETSSAAWLLGPLQGLLKGGAPAIPGPAREETGGAGGFGLTPPLDALSQANWAGVARLVVPALAAGLAASTAALGLRVARGRLSPPAPAAPEVRAAFGQRLDRRKAATLVLRWQQAKADALGLSYDTGPMRQVLGGQMLTMWREKALKASVSGYYWKYKLKSAKLRAVGVSPAASGVPTATIDCSINEEGSLVYQNGVPGDKYSGSYNVRYTAQQLSDGEWRLVRCDVLPK